MVARILCIILSLFVSITSFADQIIDELYEGSIENSQSSLARKKITEKAIEQTTLKYIAEYIGEAKIARHKKIIENNIIKQNGKYILNYRLGDLKRTKTGIKMSVSMKVSLDSLKKLLLKNGLLYELDGDPKILPMIVFEDRVNSESYSWWSDNTYGGYLKEQAKSLVKQFKVNFAKKNFYFIRPISAGYFNHVPSPFKVGTQRLEDSLSVAEVLGAQVLLKGRVLFKNGSSLNQNNRIDVRLTAYQSSNGRIIADINRVFETDRGTFKSMVTKKMLQVRDQLASDLSAQVMGAWQKGTFGSSVIKISVSGKLPYKAQQEFKSKLAEIKQIRSVRERLFSPGQVVYEVDTSSFSQTIAKLIKKHNFGSFKVNVDDVEPRLIELDVSSRQ